MKKKMRGLAVTALVVTALVASPVRATSLLQRQLDFSGGKGGTLSYMTGVGNTFSITNALVNSVIAIPSDKTLSITNGFMSFSTAACLTGCAATKIPGGFGSSPFFAYGGSLTIKGELPGMLSPVTLLMGTFSPLGLNSGAKPGSNQPNATLNSVTAKGGFNGSLGITEINPALYTAFLPYIFQNPNSAGLGYISEMFINLSFVATQPVIKGKTNGTWSGTVKSSDVIIKPVPEAPSLLLFGSVLLVMAGFLRRKLKLSLV